uniref:Uncharacterized protein n=1 Tax=Suricata suricatta TaxID=37032 RepID=A0A673SYT7_SURSU
MLTASSEPGACFRFCCFTWLLRMLSFKAPFISRSLSFQKSLLFSRLKCLFQTELVWESSSF